MLVLVLKVFFLKITMHVQKHTQKHNSDTREINKCMDIGYRYYTHTHTHILNCKKESMMQERQGNIDIDRV